MNDRRKPYSALLAFALSMSALSFTHDARGGDAPRFSELPVGRLPAPPAQAISGVRAGESVPGFFVVDSGGSFMIVADQEVAKALARGDESEARPSACIVEARTFREESGEISLVWPTALQPVAYVSQKLPDGQAVTRLHRERLVEQSGTLTLESVDAWFDPKTRGTRLIAKNTLPLKLVRGPMFGVSVYAARDEQPDGKRFVQFVAVRAPSLAAMSFTNEIFMLRPDGNVEASTGCNHARMALPLDGSSVEPSMFVTSVVLGTEVDRAPKPAAQAGMFGLSTTAANMTEVRVRMVNIQVSVSKSSRDPEPLVSVSASWATREQIDRVASLDLPSGRARARGARSVSPMAMGSPRF